MEIYVNQDLMLVIKRSRSRPGTASVFGAMVANYELGKSNGTYNAVYDADVMNTIQTGEPFARIHKIPGSWRDW